MELEKKIDFAIKLLKQAEVNAKGKPIELAYSGGKDSDVILELAKMAGIKIIPIYRNTTIDPPGTIAHVIEKGVNIVRPKMTFAQILQNKGFPNRLRRFCCSVLKEYRIMDISILGIRRCESVKRSVIYREPEICRTYSNCKKNVVTQYLPILEWSNEDVRKFVERYNVKCHRLYYDEEGKFCPERRLGCMGCPMRSDSGLSEFKKNPRLVRFWLKNGEIWWNTHELKRAKEVFKNHYEVFVRNVFFNNLNDFKSATNNIFGTVDCKSFLSEYFKIEL